MEIEKLKVIGSEEWCSFDELKIPAILARIDSGAKTSSIQAKKIKLFTKNNEDWVQFVVYPIQKNKSISVTCVAKFYDKRLIKNSFGTSEERIIIKTPITIGEDTFDIELSLANRSAMQFAMLLGRNAIAHRYVIHSGVKQVQNKILRKVALAKYKS
ncbi:ATP-dependent zinc protease [Aureibaculum sp. A20]|uniref:ATP-dependent zinc protease n=1 Tax=Aureibaculum flavum TaxID=2795986 RepID=A0ABS0WR26_9FLAO|nr:ATP-dependent zinc protease [Aureibaculum flavum]MBJ2174437.1 ATP-dependent zinc protease [Aureibaculum flavum]